MAGGLVLPDPGGVEGLQEGKTETQGKLDNELEPYI